MKVKLKSARAGHTLGDKIEMPRIPQEDRGQEYRILGTFANEVGDVIEVKDDEGRRMVLAGLASEVAANQRG